MKTACIYHSSDLDGWCSAAIVKHWWIKTNKEGRNSDINNENLKLILPELAKDEDILVFIGFNYGNEISDLSEYDKVIMCDISFKTNDKTIEAIKPMIDLKNRIKDNFIWIDHHISAIIDIKNYINKYKIDKLSIEGLRDIKFAACELTWKYFFPNDEMPEFVRLLGRYDCFGHKGTDEEQTVLEFQYGARSCISNYDECYHELTESIYYKNKNIQEILEQGKAIYQYLCTDAKASYKLGFDIYFEIPQEDNSVDEYKFICINKERFNPINFGIDYHNDGYDGCACFHFDGKEYNFSVYSDNDETDCSVIAKSFGGGGHHGASGFRLNQKQFEKLINTK